MQILIVVTPPDLTIDYRPRHTQGQDVSAHVRPALGGEQRTRSSCQPHLGGAAGGAGSLNFDCSSESSSGDLGAFLEEEEWHEDEGTGRGG